jgi:hypothetical protein
VSHTRREIELLGQYFALKTFTYYCVQGQTLTFDSVESDVRGTECSYSKLLSEIKVSSKRLKHVNRATRNSGQASVHVRFAFLTCRLISKRGYALVLLQCTTSCGHERMQSGRQARQAENQAMRVLQWRLAKERARFSTATMSCCAT